MLVGVTEAATVSRPNILFAVADDWSYGHAGAYGCPWIKTPAFDQVARQGLLFTQAFTPCGKCAPSRSCIITGRNPWQLKAAANHWCYFPLEFKSVVEALDEHGYFTGMTGKGWAPGVAKNAAGELRQMTGRPFQKRKLLSPTSFISSDDYAANFRDFLDAAPQGKPWFFWFGSWEPHRPYEYGSGAVKGGMKTSDIDHVPQCWPDNPTVRMDMLDYAFEAENFDKHLGLMLAELAKRGELSNTLVIVTSDNGMPFPHDKGYAYYNSVHLPLAIMWPDGIRQTGRVVNSCVSFIDLAPTFLNAAGVPWSQTGMAPITGRSLLPLLESADSTPPAGWPDHILISKERTDVGRPNDEGYPIRGIIKNGMLYIRNFETDRWPGGNPETGYLDTDGGPTKTEVLKARFVTAEEHFWQFCFGKLPADQLFDVRHDPDCLTNLAGKVSFAALQQELFTELKQQRDPRMFGQGHLFDEYPSANPKERNFYEKWMHGQYVDHGWILDTDFQIPPPPSKGPVRHQIP